MATTVRRPLYRFRLGGTTIELAAEPVQNEALEGVITGVLDVELAEEPAVDTGETAKLAQIERIGSTITEQFSGLVSRISAQSYPNRVVLTCTGFLARLRRVPTHDHDLTGMTDGEAWMHVADACNVPYDPADIQDAGYELGTVEDVFWLTDQPGHEMIAELDRVFGMATIENGEGRIVRFAYDRAPSDADIGQTYDRGIDAEFWRNQRDRGDLDRIVNVWQITGLSWTDETTNCTKTIWARAEGDNADLGAGVRNRAGSFQSDLIQTVALARTIALRMMRWYNRQPDELNVAALNAPAVMPGSVIGCRDMAFGIDLTASPDSVPYLVLTVDRRGDEMTLACVGGLEGDTGTVTSGVETICNSNDTTTLDTPDPFTPPPISTPPPPPTDPYEEPDPGEEEQLCLDTIGLVAASWFNSADNPPDDDWTIAGNDFNSGDDSNATAISVQKIPKKAGFPVSYRVSFTATITDAGAFEMYGTDNRATYPLHWYLAWFGAADPVNEIKFFDWGAYDGGTGNELLFGDAPDGTPVAVEIEWDRVAQEFSVTVGGVTDTIVGADTGTSSGVYIVVIARSETVGTQSIDDITIELLEDPTGGGCDSGIVADDWVEVVPTITESGGQLETTQQGGAYHQNVEIDVGNDWTLTAYVTMLSAAASHDFHFGVASDGGVTGDYEILIENTGGVMWLQAPGDSAFLAGTPFNDDVPMRIVLSWDQSTTTLSVQVSQSGRIETLNLVDAVPPTGTTFHPFILSAGTGGDTGGVVLSGFEVS